MLTPFSSLDHLSILLKPKKGDSPQMAQRKIKIKQGNKLLFSALLCALVK